MDQDLPPVMLGLRTLRRLHDVVEPVAFFTGLRLMRGDDEVAEIDLLLADRARVRIAECTRRAEHLTPDEAKVFLETARIIGAESTFIALSGEFPDPVVDLIDEHDFRLFTGRDLLD
jgi:hypothetical protein